MFTSVPCAGDGCTSWLPAVAYGSCCLLNRRHVPSQHLYHYVDYRKSLRVGGRISSVSLVHMDLTNLSFHCIFSHAVLSSSVIVLVVNPLNPELNPICHLLVLLAHHFLHVSRIRAKSLTLRLLMSYIYIWSTYS